MDTTTDKGLVLIIFFLITIIPASIPILIFNRCWSRLTSSRGQTALSLLKCFAGGVFLATCLLNLLVEGFEEYEDYKQEASFDNDYPFFHLGIAVGFFLVAFMERFAVLLSSNKGNITDVHDSNDSENMAIRYLKTEEHVHNCHVVNDAKPTRANHTGNSHDTNNERRSKDVANSPESTLAVYGSTQPVAVDTATTTSTSTESPERHLERFMGRTVVKAMVILMALSFHTIFDGLAVGLQETEADIWTTTVAIGIHKSIVAISLGLELASALPGRPCKTFFLLFLFALMAPLGVAIGMGVTSGNMDLRAQMLAGSVLQAVATGSFLYVTFFEVLGDELGHDSDVIKISVTLVGFGAMAVAKIWDSD